MQIATRILDEFIDTFETETGYLNSEGALVTQEETERLFQEYIDELDFTEHLSINF